MAGFDGCSSDARPVDPGLCLTDGKPAFFEEGRRVLNSPHQPVMLEQAVDLLRPHSGGIYLDLTLGAGGHARAILERSSPDGKLLGMDRDPDAIAIATETLAPFGDRVSLIHGAFADIAYHLEKEGVSKVDGMLADLGVSSMQLDRPERGFSFQRSGPLDMRMDPSSGLPLSDVLSRTDERDLAFALRRFADIRDAKKVARRLLRAESEGALTDTESLAKAIGFAGKRGKIHPATRVFMALRMLVNDELGQLGSLLQLLPEPLCAGARAVFISFHSLEDRAVKRRFVELEGVCTCPPGLPVCGCGRNPQMKRLSKKALCPMDEELAHNPRARSARMRAAERLAS